VSVGIFGYIGGSLMGIYQNLTGTGSPVVVAGDAGSFVRVPLLIITAATGTPTLAVDVFDGTNAFVLRAPAAMTANTSVVYDMGIPLQVGTFLRVTANAAVSVIGASSIPGAPQG
jgi:hypothetical protein